VASILAAGGMPNQEASALKLFLSELDQRIAALGVAVLGMHGGLWQGSQGSVFGGRYALSYVTTVPRTIAGGTSEIQRNIIATRGLGLPR
jgi:alkylation response protein AidB-like acyl-CoA dehydrogenase